MWSTPYVIVMNIVIANYLSYDIFHCIFRVILEQKNINALFEKAPPHYIVRAWLTYLMLFQCVMFFILGNVIVFIFGYRFVSETTMLMYAFLPIACVLLIPFKKIFILTKELIHEFFD